MLGYSSNKNIFMRVTEFLSRYALMGALLLLGVNVLALLWYLFFGYKVSFHSDSAAKVLLAREIFTLGDYFPDDWNHVNGDLFVFFGNLFIVPLLGFMPAGFTAHAISGLVSSIFILSGVWLLTGLVDTSRARRLFVVAVIAAGVSGFMAENLFGQVSYGTVIYLSCYVVYFSWRFIGAEAGRKVVWAAALLGAVVLVFWANPQRALITYGIPLFMAILVLRVKFANFITADQQRSAFACIGVILIAIVIGTGLHYTVLAGVNNTVGAASARWLDFDSMLRNVVLTLKGVLAIFGGLPTAGADIVSKAGLYESVRLVVAVMSLILMPVTVVRILRGRQAGAIFISIFVVFAFLGSLFFQLTTTVPDMSDPIQSSRYLILGVLFALILVLLQPIDWVKAPIISFSTICLSVVLVLGAYPAFVASGPNAKYVWGMPGQRNADSQSITEFLVENGLAYGYATYWNAGLVSVLSEEQVLVRQVVFDDGVPMPMRQLSSNRWYRPSTWQGETFLLLTKSEASAINWHSLAAYDLKPVRELSFGNYAIYVFPVNIAKNIPGWDTHYEQLKKFVASKKSLTQIGGYHESYEQLGSALVAEKSQSGALHYGPYISVERGRYVVTFDVVAAHNPAGSVRLDITASPSQESLGERFLLSSDRKQEFTIELDGMRMLEFRVWALGNERVIFRGVTIKRVP